MNYRWTRFYIGGVLTLIALVQLADFITERLH